MSDKKVDVGKPVDLDEEYGQKLVFITYDSSGNPILADILLKQWMDEFKSQQEVVI